MLPIHRSCFLVLRYSQGQPHYDIITKWRLNTRGVLRDGNLGRAADILRGKEVILEVFSKGTVVTSWEEIEHRTTDKDGVSLFLLGVVVVVVVVVVVSGHAGVCKERFSVVKSVVPCLDG